MTASPTTFTGPCLAAAIFAAAAPASAFDWSDTEIQYLYGKEFREPFNPRDVSKHIITLQHADGHAYGRNFAFVDMLKSDARDDHATEVYGEGYASFSLSKMSGRPWSGGALRDVNLTVGVNYGRKSYTAYDVEPRVLLPGITLDLKLPGFDFFNVDILAYVDRGRFDGRDNGCHETTYQITPAWKLPFTAGAEKFSFEGFADFIGAHGNCVSQILTQPQLRWDVGNHFGKAGRVFVGVEYQYWRNKFGIDGLRDSFPQALLAGKF